MATIGRRLFGKSIKVITVTILVTVAAAFLFSFVYSRVNSRPINLAGEGSRIIVLRNDLLLFAGDGISRPQVQEVLISLETGQAGVSLGEVHYNLFVDEFTQQGEPYKVIRMSPSVSLDSYYNYLLLFIVVVFIITFLISSIIVQRFSRENIVKPILRLTQETRKLQQGELDTPVSHDGTGEILELCAAVEELRIRLKDSIDIKERYDQNRTFLISSISHDLRTPVTAIRGYIEGIRDGVTDTPEKQERYLNTAIEKTVLINSMIEDLLLYSKLDLQQMPFELERVDIGAYIADFVRENELLLSREKKKITLDNSLPQPRYVSIDSAKFLRVIQNILDNAKRHIQPEAGEITVFLRENAAAVILEFKDNGPGIKKENLPHIFDRFYKSDASRTAGGSGLGLAIAKQIVEGMGGRIWAVSREGASIIISLKLGG